MAQSKLFYELCFLRFGLVSTGLKSDFPSFQQARPSVNLPELQNLVYMGYKNQSRKDGKKTNWKTH